MARKWKGTHTPPYTFSRKEGCKSSCLFHELARKSLYSTISLFIPGGKNIFILKDTKQTPSKCALLSGTMLVWGSNSRCAFLLIIYLLLVPPPWMKKENVFPGLGHSIYSHCCLSVHFEVNFSYLMSWAVRLEWSVLVAAIIPISMVCVRTPDTGRAVYTYVIDSGFVEFF